MRQSKRAKLLVGVALIITALTNTAMPARAADIALDASFDTDGIVTTNIGANSEFGRSVVMQTDGKILVAGYTDNGSDSDFALARYNSDGSRDNSFGTGGIVTTNIGTDDGGYSVALQPDGKILVAGYSSTVSATGFALTRYDTNGSLDTTFGTGGIVTTPIGTEAGGYSVALQPNGKILVAGYGNPGGVYSFALVRYDTNGSLDTTFDTDGNNDGIVTTPIGTNARGYSVALQPADGKILVAGYTGVPGTGGFALVRYDTNGSPDNSFGTGGVVTTTIGTDDVGLSIALQPDGKILVAGYGNPGGNYEFALVRYGATALATPAPAPIVSLHHASLDPNGGSCVINRFATTASARTPFLGYTYIPGAAECSRPGFTFQGWAGRAKPETVLELPLLRGWDDGVWRYFIADSYDLTAVWKTIG